MQLRSVDRIWKYFYFEKGQVAEATANCMRMCFVEGISVADYEGIACSTLWPGGSTTQLQTATRSNFRSGVYP